MGYFELKSFAMEAQHFMTKTIKRVKKMLQFFLSLWSETYSWLNQMQVNFYVPEDLYLNLGVHLQLIQTRNLKHDRTHSCVVYITTLSYLDTVMEILGDIILCRGQGSNPQSTDRRFLVRATYLARICISPINHFDPVGGQYSEEVCWGHLNYYCDH